MGFYSDFSRFGENLFAVDADGNSMTYHELAVLADRLAGAAEKRTVVFQMCENSIDCVSGYISFLHNGVVPLMLDRKMDSALVDHFVETYHPQYFYLPKDMTERIGSYEPVAENGSYVLVRTGIKRENPLYDELALLLSTSGSVGSPKLVRQSYKNITSNAKAIAQYLELDETERPITTLPMNYTYGLSIINSHVEVGATLLVTDSSVVSKNFWDFFKREGATSFGGVPFTYEMLKKIRFFKMDLPSLRTMTQSGAKMTSGLYQEFADWAKSVGKRFVPMYGQTEATSRIAYLPSQLACEKCGSMGFAIPGGKLTLVDVNQNVITQSGVVGELIYEGENVTLGYAVCDEDLSKGDERNGRLETGDMAQRDEDGCYYIVGRKKRFLKLYGNRVSLDEIDRLVKSNFDVDCASVGTDECLICYITDETLVDEVERFLAAKTHINPKAFRAVYIEQIPKNESGKVLYAKLKNE